MNKEKFLKETEINIEFLDFLLQFIEINNFCIKNDKKLILISVKFKKTFDLKDYKKISLYFKNNNKKIKIFWNTNVKDFYNKNQILDYLNFFLNKYEINCIFEIIISKKLEIISKSYKEIEKYEKKLLIFFEKIGILFEKIVFKKEKNIEKDISFFEYKNKKIEEYKNIQKNIQKNKNFNNKKYDLSNSTIVRGKILDIEISVFKNNKRIKVFIDTVKSAMFAFLNKNIIKSEKVNDLKKDNWFTFVIKKTIWNDKNYYKITDFDKIEPIFDREDTSIEKRIEFHIHTKMSALDGVGEIKEYIKKAIHFGHKAIAFTDHENINSFFEINKYIKKYDNLKLILGCEFNFLSFDGNIISKKTNNSLEDETFVFFDTETTGLATYYDEIIEFAAIVVKNGIVLKKTSFLIKTDKKISESILNLTGINIDDYNKNSISKKEALKRIKDIFGNYILVAHNAKFDINFINKLFQKFNLNKINNPIFDTLMFSYYLNNKILKSHRLGKLASFYNVEYEKHKAHRALYDVEILSLIFFKMFNDNDVKFEDVYFLNNDFNIRNNLFTNHINVLIKNQTGIKNLYKLVSYTHTDYLYKKPTLEKNVLDKYREGLLIGAGCYKSEIFEAAYSKTQKDLEKLIQYYDFIEIQPLEVYSHLIYKEIISKENLIDAIKRIIQTCKKYNKLIIATGDVHYVDPKDKLYRDIFISTKQLKGSIHPLNDFDGKIKETPNQHFRTTNEMLQDFNFLNDKDLIKEIVIKNTNKLSDLIQDKLIFEDKLNLPEIKNADKILKEISLFKFKEKYGTNFDKKILKRFNFELDQVIKQKFSTIYLLSYELSNYSLKMGYLIGSRGSVGSSFLAFCLDITEVNPLEPHYHCNKCFYFKWADNKKYLSGFDIPIMFCPNCNIKLETNGQTIAFESFLGIDAKSVPDIDLNFSGEFQEKAIKFVINYITEKIGKNKVFRAGTISTVAKKTAYGYLMEYIEKKDILDKYTFEEKIKISYNCVGVKKTTGQHPGGLIIIPANKNIFDFTPYNFPSNDKSKSLTTHFDYHVLKNKLLKLDVLGHDDPTALKILFKLTKKDPKKIDFYDSKIIKLFSDIKVLGIKPSDVLNETTGAIGLPEFGTTFVRRILKERNVSSFADLISVSGLSHGTNVWESNAKDLLIKHENWTFQNVIGCRDDIMRMLMEWGLSLNDAYNFMIIVKKGKGLNLKQEKELQKKGIPQWFIDSCQKISYMFPKAHATAYTIMACRFAWYKIYYPVEFYTTYFSIRMDVFDLKTVLLGKKEVEKKLISLINILNNKEKKLTPKEKKLYTFYETANEMLARGIKFEKLNLEKSESLKFKIINEDGIKKIIPPLISVDGLGIELAKKIIYERKIKPFSSSNDFKNRTKVNKTVFKILQNMGVLEKLDKFKQSKFIF